MNKTIAFIGVGNMGSAILSGMLHSGDFQPCDIILSDPIKDKCLSFTEMGCRYSLDAASAAAEADVLVLAVKPQLIDQVMLSFAAHAHNKLVLSIAAGVTITRIANALPGARIIRVMPNTPLQVGHGVTAICRGSGVTDDEYSLACRIFSCSGTVFDAEEDMLNPITALTSSSIAYFARFIGDMCAWGEDNGFDNPRMLLELVCRSAVGTAEMLMQTEFTPQTLEAAVTSPRGTTERAMAVFTERNLAKTVSDAMDACRKRADELSGS